MRALWISLVCGGLAAGCRSAPPAESASAGAEPAAGRVILVRDTALPSALEAAGIAQPVRQATLATKLMGSVTSVLVEEGARVRAGRLLARIDDRDLQARRSQADASIAEADAVRSDAETQARRMRALFADSAAAQAQLDAAETGLARADAGARAARAAARELEATSAYAEIRAPFDGVVTRRYVDPGAFVAPGAPILTVEDASRLRISVTVAPEAAAGLAPGRRLEATIEGRPVPAAVEGVVPAAGALYTVNALVQNAKGEHPSGAAATLRIAQGERHGILIPIEALVREGDLTGVRVRVGAGSELRWVRTGREVDGAVEVLSGLAGGEHIVIRDAAQPRPGEDR
jgi:RND family efflux transporter MFP subunit